MIRVLSIIEAETITGPVKNLLEFCRQAREPQPGVPHVEVAFATYRRGQVTAYDDFVAATRELHLQCEIIPEGFRLDPRVIPWLRRIAAQYAPDIIQTHSVKSHFLLRMSNLWRRYPWIAFHHGYTRPNYRMELYNRLDRWSLRKAARVLTVTNAFERELHAAGVPKERITVLHNAIPAAWSEGLPQEEVWQLRDSLAGEGAILLLSVGRLSQEKAHIDLIAAIQELSQRNSKLRVRLVLVGEGPERHHLELTAKRLKVNVKFVGQVKDVRPYFAAADIFVLPSHSEGSPNVLLEAMAAGVPIIATNVGGVPEMVTAEKTALLTPARDPEALSKAIERMLKTEDLARKLSAAARERVQTHYSPQARTRQLARVYESVLVSCSTPPKRLKSLI